MKESILTRNQRKHIRLERGEFILYNPTEEQMEIMSNLLSEQINVDTDLTAKGRVDSALIRYMLKELTNVGKDVELYSDAELIALIAGGNQDLAIIFKELEVIINEMIESLQYKQYELIVSINTMIENAKNSKKFDKLLNGLDEILEESNIDITAKELFKLAGEEEALKDKIDSLKNEKTKKIKTKTQDFKKPYYKKNYHKNNNKKYHKNNNKK